MISQELAQQLRDVGFPWDEPYCDCERCDVCTGQWTPELSELIKECGDMGLSISKHGCIATTYLGSYPSQQGKTPEEAVAKLCVALKKKGK